MLTSYLTGLVVCGGIIIAIGAQNAYILGQAIRVLFTAQRRPEFRRHLPGKSSSLGLARIIGEIACDFTEPREVVL